jgi:hypothetical protein
MGFVVTTTFAAIVWIVLWALGAKPLDAALVGGLILVLGIAQALSAPFLPGKQKN